MTTYTERPKLNKANLLEFADYVYEDDGKHIHYMKFCHGKLAKKNGEVVGCVLGEVYHYFVGDIWEFTLARGTGLNGTSIAISQLMKTAELRSKDYNQAYWDTKDIFRSLAFTNDIAKGYIERALVARNGLRKIAERLV